ncbi:MAG: DNA-binding protein Alba [Methanobrevibacter boviskoreani]|jgi:DNA-binding protein|uniref:DNA-binding protein Alba n=1 Tax=Methanobrevibacter TaxID=2172 RepID=UPI0003348487|nr:MULTISPECIES: DNA-binding protein Alba [Methanobrevibacter]AGN15953.1 DNA-binding protein Alba [Methanobrevibacter sp. AbM4]MCI6775330.1 DNA-binding protein Alba [Methanobrevibacter boviskoreani]
MSEENIIYIGNKPVMNYVLAVVTQVNNGKNEVILKARGRAINRAVDVAEIATNRFVPNASIGEIKTATEEIENADGRVSNVSSITIPLIKNE